MGLVQGIIAEYNPFHNGHLHHLRSGADAGGASHTVCVMSGAFVQRGEPAIFHKQARAEMALAAGADLVLELPAAFACASAEAFAAGAVSTLEATGIVDFLSFGSEAGSLAALEDISAVLAEEPDAYRSMLREGLDRGQSFAVARQAALSAWQHHHGPVTEAADWNALLGSPNNILALEYLKALRRQGSRMKPQTVLRRGRGYNDPVLEGTYPSATSIRRALSNHMTVLAQEGLPHKGHDPFPYTVQEDSQHALRMTLREGMPASSLSILFRELAAGRGPVLPDHFLPILLQRLRTADPASLSTLPDMEPGLEHRLIRAAEAADSHASLVSAVVSSRFPRTRVQRLLAALLIGMTDDLALRLRSAGYAQYLRVLGFRESARPLLAKMRKTATLPIIGRSAQWGRHDNPLLHELLALEGRATDTWVLACTAREQQRGGSEKRLSPVRWLPPT